MTNDERKKLGEACDDFIEAGTPGWCEAKPTDAWSLTLRLARAFKAELSRPGAPVVSKDGRAPTVLTQDQLNDLGQRLLKLTPNGSEYFSRYGDGYAVDVDACMNFLERHHHYRLEMAKSRPEAPLTEEVREIEKRQAALPSSHWKQANVDVETLLRFIKSSQPRLTEEDIRKAVAGPYDREWVNSREAAFRVYQALDRLSQGEAPKPSIPYFTGFIDPDPSPMGQGVKSLQQTQYQRDAERLEYLEGQIGEWEMADAREVCEIAARYMKGAQGEAPPAVTLKDIADALFNDRQVGVKGTMIGDDIYDLCLSDAKAIAALLRERGVNVGGE